MSYPAASIGVVKAATDLLIPHSCAGCGRIVRGGLCLECLYSQKRLDEFSACCAFCGAPAPPRSGGCRECARREFAFASACQIFLFGGLVRRAIHALKYRGEKALAEVLARPIAERLPAGTSVVTWVPAAHQRLRERGFDHGRLLAEMAAARGGRPSAALLRRERETVPQVELPPHERRTNLAGAFAARIPSPEEVFLIDDVFTTGATASEAARALKEGGASTVRVIALARSLNSSSPYLPAHL